MPTNNLCHLGDVIMYSDKIFINNCLEKYAIHIAEDKECNFEFNNLNF